MILEYLFFFSQKMVKAKNPTKIITVKIMMLSLCLSIGINITILYITLRLLEKPVD